MTHNGASKDGNWHYSLLAMIIFVDHLAVLFAYFGLGFESFCIFYFS